MYNRIYNDPNDPASMLPFRSTPPVNVTDAFQPIDYLKSTLPSTLDPTPAAGNDTVDVSDTAPLIPTEHAELPSRLDPMSSDIGIAESQPPPPMPDSPAMPMARQSVDVTALRPQIPLEKATIPSKLSLPQEAPPLRTYRAAEPLQRIGQTQSDIGFIVPHGDETTAKSVLQEYLASNPGIGLVSKSNTREIGGMDPNQLFRPEYADTPFRKQVENNLINNPDNNLIVSLHNTRHGAINAERNRSDAIAENQKGYPGYILTTDPDIYSSLKGSPFNVILQAKSKDPSDHSLSRYASEIGRKYINIEAAMGDKTGQQQMLSAAIAAYKKIKALSSGAGRYNRK